MNSSRKASISRVIDDAELYASSFLAFSPSTGTACGKMLIQFREDCERNPELADYVILRLTEMVKKDNNSQRTLANLFAKETIAAILCDHSSFRFIGYVLASELSLELLYKFLTEASTKEIRESRLYGFNSILENFSKPTMSDGGVGIDYCSESGYSFYFTKAQVERFLPELMDVKGRVQERFQSEANFGRKDVSYLHRTFKPSPLAAIPESNQQESLQQAMVSVSLSSP